MNTAALFLFALGLSLGIAGTSLHFQSKALSLETLAAKKTTS